MNPLFDRKLFVPDGEAHVMPDGRLYVYGSIDISGSKTYCGEYYHVVSTDDPKLENWVDHGISFATTPEFVGDLYAPGTHLYAPDALHKDGKYYLYYCTSTGAEGVAVSDSPAGPFGDPRPVKGVDGSGIDPAVFVDDDGSIYYLWGQFTLSGAKLNADMASIDESTLRTDILTEEEHGFHEGVSLRKHNGKYYLAYTSVERGTACCIAYAMSDNPLGPYKKCGVIVDNTGCDPQSWNDHGSIECFKGQWYVFYHRSSQNTLCNRRMCAEKIFFDENGLIKEAPMTTGGAAGAVSAYKPIDGGMACRVAGCCIVPDEGGVEKLIPAEAVHTWRRWAKFDSLDFGAGAKSVQLTARGRGTVLFAVENSAELCRIDVDSDDFTTCSADVAVSGEHCVWVRFLNGDVELRSFVFS